MAEEFVATAFNRGPQIAMGARRSDLHITDARLYRISIGFNIVAGKIFFKPYISGFQKILAFQGTIGQLIEPYVKKVKRIPDHIEGDHPHVTGRTHLSLQCSSNSYMIFELD